MPSLSVMNAIHSSAPAWPNMPLSSVKITWGSLAMVTPSARSCFDRLADVVDPEIDQCARGAAFDQQPRVAEPEERQAGRVDRGDGRFRREAGCRTRSPDRDRRRAGQPGAGSRDGYPGASSTDCALADPHGQEHQCRADAVAQMQMLPDHEPREDDTEHRRQEHRDGDAV